MFGKCVDRSWIHRHDLRSRSSLQWPPEPATGFGNRDKGHSSQLHCRAHGIGRAPGLREAHPEPGDADQLDPPARSSGEFRDRKHRHDNGPAVPLRQRRGRSSGPCHQGGPALPHRLVPRFRDAEATAGFNRHRCRGLSNDQGCGSGYSQHAGNGVDKRCSRRGHLHTAGGRGRSPEQTGQLGALHSRGSRRSTH